MCDLLTYWPSIPVKPRVHQHYISMVTYTCNPGKWEVETGRLGVTDHPLLHRVEGQPGLHESLCQREKGRKQEEELLFGMRNDTALYT